MNEPSPITDEELALLHSSSLCAPACVLSSVTLGALIARLRAAEARAETGDEVRENEEARKVIQAIAAQTSESEADTVQAFLGAYTRGRADERAEVCAEVERAIRLYRQMSGTSDEVGALSALLDDLAMGTHVTGAKNEGKGG